MSFLREEVGLWAAVPLERFGLRVFNKPDYYYEEEYNKHKQVVQLEGKFPLIAIDTFIAPDATIIGNVEIMNKASVWYNCVINAKRLVRIGAYTNIQDNTIITEALDELTVDHDGSTIIGHNVVVGHGCLLKGCTVESYCSVGMGSVLNEGSYMETESILASGSVLLPNARVRRHELWAGNPAKRLRQINEDELEGFRKSALKYWETAQEHEFEFHLPHNFAYVHAEQLGIKVGYQVEGVGNQLGASVS